MKIKKIQFLIFLILIVSGCASKPKVLVKSIPEKSDVVAIGVKGDVEVLGKTPLDIDTNSFFRNSEVKRVRISFDRYKSKEIILTKPYIDSNITINAELEREEDSERIKIDENQEKIASLIANSQNLIGQKNYQQAETLLLSLVQDFPSLSVSYDFLGNLYYLKRENGKALKYYKMAEKLNPNKPERKDILKKLGGGI